MSMREGFDEPLNAVFLANPEAVRPDLASSYTAFLSFYFRGFAVSVTAVTNICKCFCEYCRLPAARSRKRGDLFLRQAAQEIGIAQFDSATLQLHCALEFQFLHQPADYLTRR